MLLMKKMSVKCIQVDQNSKQYLGSEKAKTYCLCTVEKLSEKFSDNELESIFNQIPEKIVEDTQFASKFCEKII